MLTVITGCMFAGKTKELIKKINTSAEELQKDYIVFKPVIDTRYSQYSIVTHDGITMLAQTVDRANKIFQLSKDYSIIGIDEVQFFDREIIDVCRILADSRKEIIVSGLSTDYLGKPFGSVPELLSIADEIVKLYSICTCGNKATHNKRISQDNKSQIMLGSENEYIATCRYCFQDTEKIEFEDSYLSI